MRFTRAILALAAAAATVSVVHAQEARIATTTDVPGSASPSPIVYEDAAVPAELPANSPWLDPLNVRFFAETGFNLVRPVQHGPVLVGSRPVANAFGPAGIVTTKFRFPLQVAPRVTLGAVTSDGYGAMMSWMGFEDGATTLSARNSPAAAGLNFASVPLPGIPGFTSPSLAGAGAGVVNDAMSFTSRVRMQVWDGDWFCDTTCLGWNARTTVGARYAYLSQSYTALRVNSGTGTGGTLTADNDYITSGHNFSGFGPATGMIVRRPVFNTNIHLFFSDRFAVLFGSNHQRSNQLSTLAGTIGGVPTATTTVSNSFQDSSICVPCEDIEMGFEWARDFDDAHVFVRTAFIDQTYFDAGNATSVHGNLTIIGMSVVAGLTY